MSTWVLLRGLMRETRHWGTFPSLLREAVPDIEVVALDLPGNGSLHGIPSPVRIQDITEHCRQALAARGHRPPYHLLALSLGAMVAIDWSARYPRELDGCVLINTSLRPFNPFYRRLRPRNYLALARMAFAPPDTAMREALIFRLTSRRSAARAETLHAWIGYANEFKVSRSNALRQLFAAARYRAPAIRPRTPLLFLAGAADQLVDPQCSKRLAGEWHAPLAIHPDAGHDIPLDDPQWVSAQVRLWMAAKAARQEDVAV